MKRVNTVDDGWAMSRRYYRTSSMPVAACQPITPHLRTMQFRPAGFIASRSMRGYHRTAASQLANCHPELSIRLLPLLLFCISFHQTIFLSLLLLLSFCILSIKPPILIFCISFITRIKNTDSVLEICAESVFKGRMSGRLIVGLYGGYMRLSRMVG